MLNVDDAGVDGAALGFEGVALGVAGAAVLLSSATGVSGVEVATVAAAGGLEDADSLGDLRLCPRDESIPSRCVTGFPRLFSSTAAVTTRCGNNLS